MFLLRRCRCVHLDEALQTIKKSQLIFPEESYKLTLNLSFCVNLVTSEVGEVRLKSRIERKKKCFKKERKYFLWSVSKIFNLDYKLTIQYEFSLVYFLL